MLDAPAALAKSFSATLKHPFIGTELAELYTVLSCAQTLLPYLFAEINS